MTDGINPGRTSDVVGIGLDWLTVTQVEGREKDNLFCHAKETSTGLYKAGHISKDWAAMGYEGFAVGPLKYGERGHKEAILILSGPEAHRYGFGPAITPDRVTRLDVQVTLRFSNPEPFVAAKTFKRLQTLYRNRSKKPFLNLLQDRTGDTLYIGRRSSAVSLRFYDRSIKMGEEHLGTVWRYEVQYRQQASKKAYGRLRNQTEPNLHCLGLVAAEFEKRAIEVRFGADSSVTAIEIGRTLTTIEGQVAWLEKCVAPVVSQLCLLGEEEAVISALSLRGMIQHIRRKEKWQ